MPATTLAQEFGDHPDMAARRMRRVRQLTARWQTGHDVLKRREAGIEPDM